MTSSREAISRRSEAGSKILPCPQELLAEHGQKLAILGQGGGLALSLFCHKPGDYNLEGQAPQHFLYFLPLPHGHGSFLPVLGSARTIGFGATADPSVKYHLPSFFLK